MTRIGSFILMITLMYLNINCQIPTNGLQLSYPFCNTTLDESGNNLHGTSNGASITTDCSGNINNAYLFNGSSDYITVPNDPSIKPNFPFTISLWIKVNSFQTSSTVLYASDETTNVYNGFWIGYLSSGVVSAGYGDGGGQGPNNRITKKSITTIGSSGWHSIVATFNGLNDIDLYIDCNKEVSGPYSGSANTMIYTGATGSVGRSFGHHPNSYHDGEIDEIRIYNRALNSTEINALCSICVSCKQNDYYTSVIPMGDYQVANTIGSNGVISSPINVSFLANCIELDSGFEVKIGAEFLADIVPCN